MPRLLVLLTLPPDVREFYVARIRARFPELQVDVADHHSKAGPFMPSADMLLTFGAMLNYGAFDDAPKLKWVQALGTGVDGITDQPSLRPDVIVTNIRGIHGAPMSEAAIIMMLALCRDLPAVVHNQDQARWARWPAKLIDGKTAGIVGIGAIAETLAPRLKALGMTVVGFSSTVRDVPGFDRMHHRSEILARANELDFLVLLAPYSKETHNIIDARVLAALKPTSYVINLARGGILDEAALIEALESRQIAGAALDVFQTEPLPADHPLWKAKNLIVTPHLGGFCDVYAERALPTIEHNIACFLRGDFDAMENVVRR